LEENRNELNNKSSATKAFMGGLVIGLAIAVMISGCMFLYSRSNYSQASATKDDDSVLSGSVVRKLKLLEDSIDDYYLEEKDDKEIADSLYKGLIEGLGDKYSTYYTAEELEEVKSESEGVFFGIGASITIDSDTSYAKVAEVLPNTPAEEAGLKDNDLIVQIEEESTAGLELNEIVRRIKGEENTEVKLTVYREGEYDYLEFVITRKPIEMETVEYSMEDDKIAYIRITEFDDITVGQFKEAMESAQKDGMKGLIIDLRDNPGGNLSAVVDIAGEILPKGLIVYTEDKYGDRNEYSCDGDNELQVPLVVLVNGNSASASEILAGAVKDYEIGTIVGEKTYGKGVVQKIFALTDGSAVKLTVSHYFTPKGTNIHKVGIEPDEAVELDYKKYMNDKIDTQLEKAKEVLSKKIK